MVDLNRNLRRKMECGPGLCLQRYLPILINPTRHHTALAAGTMSHMMVAAFGLFLKIAVLAFHFFLFGLLNGIGESLSRCQQAAQK
jgi:hypothetical protein